MGLDKEWEEEFKKFKKKLRIIIIILISSFLGTFALLLCDIIFWNTTIGTIICTIASLVEIILFFPSVITYYKNSKDD